MSFPGEYSTKARPCNCGRTYSNGEPKDACVWSAVQRRKVCIDCKNEGK